MKKILVRMLLVAFAVGVIVGCRTAPVYNVEDQTIVANVDNVSMDGVENAIMRAAGPLGWQVKKVEPGHMVATLNVRKHMAQVDITYDTDSYSISYKNSSHLKYDGSNIHSNYNGWVQNLQRNIDVQLSTL
ncbi:MAG: hypothetical protein ACQETD_03170 [Pseudomonadota bacterium]